MIVLVMFYVAMAVIAVATLAASVALFFLGQAWQPMLVLVVGSSMFYTMSNRRCKIESGKVKEFAKFIVSFIN